MKNQEKEETILLEENATCRKVSKDVSSSNTKYFSCPVPFPRRLIQKKKKIEHEKENFDIFRKVEVNIPLLEAIRQVPRYAKFLKTLVHKQEKT